MSTDSLAFGGRSNAAPNLSLMYAIKRYLKYCSRLAALFLVLYPTFAGAGPIFPSRTILILPRWTQIHYDSVSSLSHMGFWGGATRSFRSDGERFAWQIELGGIVELARWSENASLLAMSDQLLQADIYNDISFNPSGVFWEEGLLFDKRAEGFDWQVGLLYRCRHDVDNGERSTETSEFKQRTLIYLSLPVKFVFHPLPLTGSASVLPWLRSDIFLVRQDYRIPRKDELIAPNLNALAFTLSGGFLGNIAAFNTSAFYLRGETTLSFYGSKQGFGSRFSSLNRATLDGRIETGYELTGTAARLQLFLSAEHFADDLSSTIPKSSSFYSVGFRFSGVELGI